MQGSECNTQRFVHLRVPEQTQVCLDSCVMSQSRKKRAEHHTTSSLFATFDVLGGFSWHFPYNSMRRSEPDDR